VQLANLTRKGFEQKDVSILMSPRTVIMWAENFKLINDIKISFHFTFLNKCDESEIDIYKEYFQRAFGIDL
jgi:cobaltochelatase CobS